MTQDAAEAWPVAAVVLAAGASQRFGNNNKLLMPWGRGEGQVPVLRHVVEVVLGSGVSHVVVVTGNSAEAARGALHGLAATFVHNEDWQRGMGASIALGIGALRSISGALIVPADMPGLTRDLIQSLVGAFWNSEGSAVVVPVTALGAQRNPVLWPRSAFPALRALQGDRGAKAMLDADGLRRIDIVVEDERVFADIDREEDYLALRKALDA